MNEPFDLPVTYNGKERLFPARLLQLGYTHRFQVDVYGTEVLFEPDEERRYRAIADADALPTNVDTGLLQAIAEGIEAALK